MFLFLSVLAILLLLIHLALNYNEKARLIKKIPGPRDTFIIGNALEIMASPVEVMNLGRKWSSKWPGIYRFWGFPFGAVFIYNPEDIETVISTVKYNNKSVIYGFLHSWLRDGLLVSKDEKWHKRRKLLTPAFHFNILKKFFVILEENSQKMVKELATTHGRDVDIVPMLSEFTLHSICETAMGTQLTEDTTGASRSYKQAVYGLGELFLNRVTRLYLYPDVIFNNSSWGKRLKNVLSIVHSFTKRVIKDRRDYVNKYGISSGDIEEDDGDDARVKKKRTAMLDLLLVAEKDGLIDEAGIQEEVDTFMFEGHDTTASGLTFCLLELANKDIIQDRVYDELRHIFGDSTRQVTMEDLTQMRYLELCIKESLRLYPPVHFISRHLGEQATLSGYTVPSGTICHIPILDLHRSPKEYKDPLVFNPDRFLPENTVDRHPYAYIPFSAGPRNCIGQKFAMMEMKLAISQLLRNFKLTPVTRTEDLEFTADLVLRNSKPIHVTFARR